MNREWSSKTRRKEPLGRSRSPEEWVYGVNPVLEVLRAGRGVAGVYLSSSRRGKVPEIEEALAARGLQAKRVDEAFFDERFRKGHQGVAARVAARSYSSLEDLFLIPVQDGRAPFFLILDGVEDPRNFGAILRVADAGGVHGVVIQSHRSASLTSEAVKASAGAAEHVKIAMVPNVKHAIREMQEQGIMVVGADAHAGETVWDANLSGPLALVIGSEGAGMRRTVREHCDRLVMLPMRGRVNSLNAAVAAGAIIFEIIRQRVSI